MQMISCYRLSQFCKPCWINVLKQLKYYNRSLRHAALPLGTSAGDIAPTNLCGILLNGVKLVNTYNMELLLSLTYILLKEPFMLPAWR